MSGDTSPLYIIIGHLHYLYYSESIDLFDLDVIL